MTYDYNKMSKLKNEISKYIYPCLANIVMEYNYDPKRYEVNIHVEYVFLVRSNSYPEREMIDELHPFLLNGIYNKRGSNDERNYKGKQFKHAHNREHGFAFCGGYSNPAYSGFNYYCVVTDLTHQEMIELIERINRPIPIIKNMISTSVTKQVFTYII
jgi:hypothetical protein